MTVIKVELLGEDGGRTPLFEGSQVIDLLTLQDFSEAFSLTEGVPSGSYEKIRLTLSDLELVSKDESGAIISSIHPKLPGNGKLDLNPRGSFTVTSGETLMIEIDMDVDKSIKITGNGNGNVQFRPVVFVNVIGSTEVDEESSTDNVKLSRVQGVIDAITDEGTIRLCDSNIDECLNVIPTQESAFFSSETGFSDSATPSIGDKITAFGNYTSSDNGLAFNAVLILLGAASDFTTLEGILNSISESELVLALGLNQGAFEGSEISVIPATATLIFDRSGNQLNTSNLTEGTAVSVTGLLSLSSVSSQLIAALIVVNDQTTTSDGKISGNVVSPPTDGLMTVQTDAGDICVDVTESQIFFVGEDSDSGQSIQVDTDALVAGMEVDIYGEAGDNCTHANIIIAFGDDDDDN